MRAALMRAGAGEMLTDLDRSYCKVVIDFSICKAPGFVVFCVYFHEGSSIPCSCVVGKNFCLSCRKLMSHSFKWTLPPTVSM